jgi:hypothetical protein
VAGLLYWGGERFETKLRHYMDIIGWSVVVLIIMAIALYKLLYGMMFSQTAT